MFFFYFLGNDVGFIILTELSLEEDELREPRFFNVDPDRFRAFRSSRSTLVRRSGL
jgi:hypothetical protein